MVKHVIWSNLNLNLDDWKEWLLEDHPNIDPDDEDALYRLIVDTNNDYLDDERCNLDIQLSQPILVIADLGLWHGRRMGYKEIESGNIRDCLYDPNEYVEMSTLSGTLTATATCAASPSTTTAGTTACSGRGRTVLPIPSARI